MGIPTPTPAPDTAPGKQEFPMRPLRSRRAFRGHRRFRIVLLTLACLAAGGPAAAATTADEAVGAEDLKSLVRPLTKEELESEAAAWRDLLKAKVAEISRLRVETRQARTDAAADPAVEPPESKETAAAISRLQAERTLLGDRLRVVLDEWEKKGGDPADYRRYATAVGGLEIAANDVRDAGSVLVLLKGWLFSEQGGIRWLWNLAKFLTILAAFWILARVISTLVGQAVGRFRGASMLLRNFLVTFVRQAIMLIGFVVALSALEINTSPLLALIGGAAFVVGLALQGTLANFAHGLLILAYRPFDEGDFIDAGGVSGIVQSMNMLSTTIRTPDNKKVIVPNAKIGGDTITNATGTDTRRVDLTFGIGYESDIDAAQAVLERIVADHPAVLRDPAPVVRLHQLADSSVNFVVRPWTKTPDYWTVYWDITREVKRRFDAAGITIPYPQRDVHIHQVPSA